MENTKTIGEKLREAQNYYERENEKAFESWVEAILCAKENEMMIAASRNMNSLTYSRTCEPLSTADSIPPFPSSEVLRRIEERLAKKYSMKVEIFEPNLCKIFSIVFSYSFN
jgi:hypothetical protein